MLISDGSSITQGADLKQELLNRGFCYGDGFFETIRIQNSQPCLIDLHIERIEESCNALGFRAPMSHQMLIKGITDLVTEGDIDNGRLRMYIYRKEGGLYTPGSSDSKLIMTATLESPGEVAQHRAKFYAGANVQFTDYSFVKSLSADIYVQASRWARNENIDQAILTDFHGNIAETQHSNIFWIKNDHLYTPSLKSGCVSGVRRKLLLSNYEATECLMSSEELSSTDFIFTSNAMSFAIINKIGEIDVSNAHPLFNKILESSI